MRITSTRFYLIFFISFLPLFCAAQFKKANAHFKEKKFASAIPLYESGLQKKASLLAQTRLAYSYRMLNRMADAEKLYAKIVEIPRARTETMRYYAEALMSNAKYVEAKEWFQKYSKLEPQDTSVLSLIRACDIAPSIKSYFKTIAIREFAQNSEQDDNTPIFYDGQIVFTSDRPSGALLKQKSSFTGRDYLRIYSSSYNTDLHVFEEGKSFSSKLNSFNKNTANPSFALDEQAIYFSQNNSEGTERGEYKLQLYRAEQTENGKWRHQSQLSFCKGDFNYMHPTVSPDGKLLFFISDIKGQGGFDLFTSHKGAKGWSRPKNLGAVVNTAGHEAFPYYHPDGRLFFASKGHAGFGGFDIFVTYYDTLSEGWTKPLNLGRPINSPTDDVSFSLAHNDSTGLFASSRNGGDDDIFMFWLGGRKRLETALHPEKLKKTIEKDTSSSRLKLALDIDEAIPSLETFANDLETQRPITEEGYILRHTIYSNDEEKAVPVSAAEDVSLLLELLNKYPDLNIEIGVHAAKPMDKKVAIKLCEARADAWRALLIVSGISGERISSKAYGLKYPILTCQNCTPKTVERVEIKRLTKK